MPKRTLAQILFLAALDALIIAIAFVFSYYLRSKILIFITPGWIPVINLYLRVLILVVILWLSVFKLFGIYDRKYSSLFDEVASIFAATAPSVLILLGLLFLYRELWFSRQVIIYAWVITFVLSSASRIFLVNFQKSLFSKGIGITRSLIIDAGETGQALAMRIKDDPALGYRVVGFLDDDEKLLDKSFHGAAVLGKISEAKDIIKGRRIDEIIIASQRLSSSKILDIITECERKRIKFKIVPGILEIMASRVNTDEVGGIPLVTISEIQLRGFNAVLKRGTDLMASLLALIIFSPILLLTAIAIKLNSKGPVFFRQERVGRDGKPFKMYKFRSMVKDAEKLFPKLALLSEVEGPMFKIKKDPRVTSIGAFLRRSSLDEIPQLLNVWRGEMSLVGPRPPIPREVKKYDSWHIKRLRIAPGMTGLWQVSGRSDLPFEDMVRYDIYYIENWSLWLDFKIILQTIPAVISGGGAY
ncbi:MAG: undecaprenyl-phosphate glucose phosphotransferase [Candidatus Saganbacteria bacterium]|nr:undecaprenyl-phosphate glucose phosphotransferase [Candidatus Saganbacteria bacterium]